MNFLKQRILPIFLGGVWISISEFIRNEFVLKHYWTKHYDALGITFPSEPINGAVWGIWSILFSTAIYIISRKFTLMQTTFLTWFIGFVLMWVVIGNMGVLPYGILWYAIPLSLLETFIAAFIMIKLS